MTEASHHSEAISDSVHVAGMRMLVRHVQPQRRPGGRSWVVAVEVARPAATDVYMRRRDAKYASTRAEQPPRTSGTKSDDQFSGVLDARQTDT